ncbi:MAG: tetratricopeptide repeat protein [Acidobacteria bacterium]|nr:tetratricopeptide repeat protein [Acidobacteriota bacterium]
MLIAAPVNLWAQTGESPGEKQFQAGMDAYQQGNYAEAEKHLEAAVAAISEGANEESPPLDPRMVLMVKTIADIYFAQNRQSEAKELGWGLESVAGYYIAAGMDGTREKVTQPDMIAQGTALLQLGHEILERVLGPEHPDLVESLGFMAEVYSLQEKHTEAEALLKRMLPIQKRVLAIEEEASGPEDEKERKVLSSLEKLASLYVAQKSYAEAEPLYKRALAMAEKRFGPEHFLAASRMTSLATIYTLQQKYADAEPLYQRAWAIDEKELKISSVSSHLTGGLAGLAELYRTQGKYAEAEPLYERLLAVTVKGQGPEGPSVPSVLETYAVLLRQMGRDDEAKQMEVRAGAIRAKQSR